MAMGGDPFFLDDGANEEESDNNSVDKEVDGFPSSEMMGNLSVPTKEGDDYESWSPISGKGPRPKKVEKDNISFEWDGEVNEDAYFD